MYFQTPSAVTAFEYFQTQLIFSLCYDITQKTETFNPDAVSEAAKLEVRLTDTDTSWKACSSRITKSIGRILVSSWI